METKNFIDESLKPSIKTELPKLLKLTIKLLSQNKLDRLMDFYVTMDKSKFKKMYKINHPEEYETFEGTTTGKQLRLLRFAASLLRE